MQQVGQARRFWWRALDAPNAPAELTFPLLRAETRLRRPNPRRARRQLRLVFVLVACGLLGWGLWTAAADPQKRSLFWTGRDLIDRSAGALGLEIVQISVTGHHFTSDKKIFAEIAKIPAKSLLSFDAAAMQRQIERLPWIASARVQRVLPGEIRIQVWERQPHAVWLDRDRRVVLDRTGRELAEIGSSFETPLLEIGGFGAPEDLPQLDKLLAAHPRVKAQLARATRVEGRRWRLALKNGTNIELPADNPASALLRLVKNDPDGKLVAAGFAVIDLRDPDRIVLSRLKPKVAVLRPSAHLPRVASR